MQITLTRRWPRAVEDHLSSLYDVARNEHDKPLSREQLALALQTADALCPTVTDRIDAGLLDTPNLKSRIIASYGVGYDHIDVAAAAAKGIVVTNTPEVLTDCTADLAMTLMLGIARRAGEGERHVRSGAWTGWRPTHMMGAMVSGKTLGIVGLGRIGLAVAERAHRGFGMRIIYHNRSPRTDDTVRELHAEFRSLEELLAEADFVSLHCPSSPTTRHLLNAKRFAAMRPSAFLINTARGDVVEPAALVEALETGRIAGAGLDVYEGEPAVPQALLALDNVMLLPHLGSATVETRVAMGMRVAENLRTFFAGQDPPDRLG